MLVETTHLSEIEYYISLVEAFIHDVMSHSSYPYTNRIPTVRTILYQIKATSDCVNWSTDIGAEFGDVRPLDEARMCTLIMNRVQLLDLMDPNDAFVTELASRDVGCITRSQREHIVDTVHRRDRNEKLLEFITRRSVANFNKFINVLSRQQAHLVPLLLTDGGKTYISF